MQNEGFLPFLAARMMPYRSSSVQRASIPGSRLARSPRIGNPVSGKFRVDL
ncbi:hypothetical protein SB359474_3992 [Shigella boydii 3594-74]|nr:hypothetical protein SB359474_3992 [Shigella boydii 3594-74]EHV65643.1 hypothetical protein ECDEC6B_0093 [Escherichia coli DEC6B]